MPVSPLYKPLPAYSTLPRQSDPVAPARFPRHRLRHRHQAAAAEVGLDTLSPEEWEAAFARFEPLPDNLPTPLALRYHGHQFMSYNPALGDGRGFLFAQLEDQRGRLMDLGTKGSGRTPYARGGDGRLTLKGGVREVLAAELLEARGVPTCRILSLFETGEHLIRGDEPSPTRSSVMVRLSHGHVRIGMFQRLEFEDDAPGMEALLAYCAQHLTPEVAGASDLPAAFLAAVATRLANLTAAWMAAGFVHGVLNTDNLNITGESFDYGPWRFLPRFDPAFTAAYFDHSGLYCFARQPSAVLWSLGQLHDALALVGDRRTLTAALAGWEALYNDAFEAAFLRRLGLVGPHEQANALIRAWVSWAEAAPVSFEHFFFDWQGGLASQDRARAGLRGAVYERPDFAPVREGLRAFLPRDPDALSAHRYSAEEPCDCLIDEVEALWAHIAERDDWGPLSEKVNRIRLSH